MSELVLDASAVLASIFQEPGHEMVDAALAESVIGSVNLAEVVAKLVDRGYSDADARFTVDGLGIDVVAFSAATATEAGLIRKSTRAAGLSLGDRACLALAVERGVPALTADKRWASIRTKAKVRQIR